MRILAAVVEEPAGSSTAVFGAGAVGLAAALAVIEATRGGSEFSLEAAGSPAAVRAAVHCLANTGVCGITGAPAIGTEVSLDVTTILTAAASSGGSSRAAPSRRTSCRACTPSGRRGASPSSG
jgi:Zn-dependent alcohol dehydrogenase